MRRNPHFQRLQDRYLFARIEAAKQELLKREPNASLIDLGIGDTTRPLSSEVAEAMATYSRSLATEEEYEGYGPVEGWSALREKIAHILYRDQISADEVFISDGAKCDLGRLSALFGSNISVAIQDPSYPVYLDLAQLMGHEVQLLPCTPDNGFFPEQLPNTDLITICSPNNPTGAVATHEQLRRLVEHARERGSLILFDAAYAPFIQDPSLPRSIYEIEGAHEVAIELGSFSKFAGFTGVRLGWNVVPKKLSHSLHTDWVRLLNTIFNGPSNIAQAGGLACLDAKPAVQSYLDNAAVLKNALQSAGVTVHGGDNSPYLWMECPNMGSCKLFRWLLEEAHLITVPGVGFGPSGEGFLRLSAFGDQVEEAATRLRHYLSDLREGQSSLAQAAPTPAFSE